jgi:hypothetical protein
VPSSDDETRIMCLIQALFVSVFIDSARDFSNVDSI